VALPSPAGDTADSKTDWNDKSRQLEEYFVEQAYQLTKSRTGVHGESAMLPRKFPTKPPAELKKIMEEFLEEQDGESKSGCRIKIHNPSSNSMRNMESYYFAPVVLNNIRKTVRVRQEEWEAQPLEGYSICFDNEANEHDQVQMVMEVVMVSEHPSFEDSEDETFESAHLTPLAEELEESIEAANSVLNEMHLMEKREGRMRITAESINARVKYFSYISVGILLVVTYIQVSYLKRYFHKKKLM
jgi:hypothetical protein